jgi:hypothetical protein
MKARCYGAAGMPLLRFPTGWNDVENARRRNIGELREVTAAQMLGVTDIHPDAPTILCGAYERTYPVLRQLIKMPGMPYVLLGTQRDLTETCLASIPAAWSGEGVRQLPVDNGKLILQPGAETELLLKETIPAWRDHLLIFCLGSGLQMDAELLNLLNGHGHYLVLSEALSRSVKGSLTVTALLSAMDNILVGSIGTSAKDLMAVLPSYECEKITNTTDFSSHRNNTGILFGDYHSHSGTGFRVSQARTLETKCIVTQDELTRLQDTNTTLVYNARTARTWVASIVR